MQPPRSLLLVSALFACSPAEISVGEQGADTSVDGPRDSDDPTGSPGDSDTDGGSLDDTGSQDTSPPVDTGPSPYDDAVLVIRSPQSASVHLLANGIPVDGEIQSPTGNTLPFQDIRWTLRDVPEVTPHVGLSTTFTDVPAGRYTLDVEARLPNGDRLTQSLSQVRVQHRYAGTWVGTVRIVTTSDFQGTPITSNCIGGLAGGVNAEGDAFDASGACTVSLGGLGSFNIDVALDGDIDEPDVDGDIIVGTGLLANTLSWSGRIRGGAANRTLEGSFRGVVGQLQLDGTFTGRQINNWITP